MKNISWIKNFIIFTIMFVMSMSCAVKNEEKEIKYYSIPEQRDDGWEVSDIQSEGLELNLIEILLKKIARDHYKNIHNFLIIKNGKLILDEFYKKSLTIVDSYVQNRDINVHAMMSVTKSIVSILTGIAINNNTIGGIGERVYSYFPEYESFDNWTKNKSKITIKNFLTMRHGLDWDETSYEYSDPLNTYNRMEKYNDWVKFTLDRELISEQGKTFAYSTGASHTIEALISNAAGISFPEFTDQYLFRPLKIKKRAWFTAPNGRADDVYMTVRDMAKIGQLVVNHGRWKGKQLVSVEWINESTRQILKISDKFGYGYFWWRYIFKINGNTFKTILAWGYGGQFIFVFPDINMVCCFTSGNYLNDLSKQPFEMIEKYILPSIH